jgi:hypothetical protein
MDMSRGFHCVKLLVLADVLKVGGTITCLNGFCDVDDVLDFTLSDFITELVVYIFGSLRVSFGLYKSQEITT